MSYLGMHHTGFTVRDLDRSIAFYRDVLGLELAQEPSPVFADPELGARVGVPGANLRQVSFKVGETGTIELLEYPTPPSPIDRPMPMNALGAGHAAFLVADIQAKKRELETRGVEFLSDVNVVDEGPLAGWRWVYMLDPDGITLELVEIAYTRDEERAAAIEAYLAGLDGA
jgi:catechol 2,3-dioxygenase-like lactoylglutathione lyase family enzyme